jgi:hypothetical protein
VDKVNRAKVRTSFYPYLPLSLLPVNDSTTGEQAEERPLRLETKPVTVLLATPKTATTWMKLRVRGGGAGRRHRRRREHGSEGWPGRQWIDAGVASTGWDGETSGSVLGANGKVNS